jgi:hypothetical protein
VLKKKSGKLNADEGLADRQMGGHTDIASLLGDIINSEVRITQEHP